MSSDRVFDSLDDASSLADLYRYVGLFIYDLN